MQQRLAGQMLEGFFIIIMQYSSMITWLMRYSMSFLYANDGIRVMAKSMTLLCFGVRLEIFDGFTVVLRAVNRGDTWREWHD